MKRFLLSLSLLAVLTVAGCTEPGTATKNDLLPEVNKAALESTIAKNDITLVEFTATW